jgi:6-phosphogluconate dehydrogenase
MHIHYIGLGKMGLNMVERMIEKGHTVDAFDPSETARAKAKKAGAKVFPSIPELFKRKTTSRTVWLMVPHQAVDAVLDEVLPLLSEQDTLIEGGNSPYKKTKVRAKKAMGMGIRFLDAGVSGGPRGAREGACIMVGGDEGVFDEYEQLFADLSVENGYLYAGVSGAGHFVKMIHNGIEYGMMQAIAEGFDIMRASEYTLSLTDIAELYNHGSVIESRLVGWLKTGFDEYGEDLAGITGSASASGEGAWTVETAHALSVPATVIEDSLKAREKSQKKPSYQGQLVSVMRNQFGGHSTSS